MDNLQNLLNQLPVKIGKRYICIFKIEDGQWFVRYRHYRHDVQDVFTIGCTLQEAAEKMLEKIKTD